jgi:hypothetical protein
VQNFIEYFLPKRAFFVGKINFGAHLAKLAVWPIGAGLPPDKQTSVDCKMSKMSNYLIPPPLFRKLKAYFYGYTAFMDIPQEEYQIIMTQVTKNRT